MDDLRQSPEFKARKFALDLWTAAFFWPLSDSTAWVPSDGVYRGWVEQGFPINEAARIAVTKLAGETRFFHWSLEFPDVFNSQMSGAIGFSVVIGNPPWERIKLQEEEHWIDDPHISNAPNKAERERRIKDYRHSFDLARLARVARFDAAKHASDAWSKFVRMSGRWPLTAVGDVNTYALFGELAWMLLDGSGRMGLVLPTGIATDDTCKHFFSHIVSGGHLASLFDFENRGHLFPALHTKTKFCLITLSGKRVGAASFCFLSTKVDDLSDPIKVFQLELGDLRLFNPNTGTCPLFRTRPDAELARQIYKTIPVFVDESRRQNSWGVRFMTMFHMANDSHRFSVESKPDSTPLYEAKLFYHYDHRWATYQGADTRELTLKEKIDPRQSVVPRYWIQNSDVSERLSGVWEKDWLLAFRDVTDSRNERSAVFSILPRLATGHKAPLIFPLLAPDDRYTACLLGNLSSLVLDYLARQKIGAMSLSYFILKQVPVLPPEAYTANDVEFIVRRVIPLVYTTWNLEGFARDMGYHGPPFPWDEEQRGNLRAQLDAYYFKLYGLTRKQARFILDPHDLTDRELASILDPLPDDEHADKISKTTDFPGETFRVLKQNEIRRYGEYRTQRLVLGYDQAIRAGEWSLLEMPGLPQLDLEPKPKVKKKPEREQRTLERETGRTGTGGNHDGCGCANSL